MADPTEAEIQTGKDAAEAAAKTEADAKAAAGGGDDKEGLRKALAKQAGEKDAEIAALQKKLAANDASALKVREDKLKEDNKLQELLDTRDKTIREMTDKSTAASRALLESTAREKLRDLGMLRTLSLAGAVAGLPADATAESLDAWTAQIKVGNEDEFKTPVKPIGQSSLPGGPAADGGGGDLATRLKSEDKKVRAAANDERLKKRLTGEL